jgi:hypothetical protein
MSHRSVRWQTYGREASRSGNHGVGTEHAAIVLIALYWTFHERLLFERKNRYRYCCQSIGGMIFSLSLKPVTSAIDFF